MLMNFLGKINFVLKIGDNYKEQFLNIIYKLDGGVVFIFKQFEYICLSFLIRVVNFINGYL